MESPVAKATLQAAALSALSNVLGQLITCWQSKIPYTIDTTRLFHFILFSALACPPNFAWQTWLEAQFPGRPLPAPKTPKKVSFDTSADGQSSTAAATSLDSDASSTAKRLAANASPQQTQTQTQPNGNGGKNTSLKTPADQGLNVRNTLIKFVLDQTLGAIFNTVLFIAGMGLIRGQPLSKIHDDVVQGFLPLMLAGIKLWPLVSLVSFTVIPAESRLLFGSLIGVGWGVFLSLISGGKR